jgi:hypothetical protein
MRIDPTLANIGGRIGRGIANGELWAWIAAVGVIVAFAVTYRLMVWFRSQ